MTKQEFLSRLRLGLSDLPKNEIDERVSFYNEMIDDRTEEGLSESEAVDAVGSVEEIIKQIAADFAPQTNKKLKTGAVVLLAVSSPLWASLLIAAFAVALSLYVSIWAVVISLWACFAVCAVCAPGGVVLGFTYIFSGNPLTGVTSLGLGAFSAGLAIFLFFGCKELTRLTVLLSKKAFTLVRHFFSKKGEGK